MECIAIDCLLVSYLFGGKPGTEYLLCQVKDLMVDQRTILGNF
jgi:hypothetical protein